VTDAFERILSFVETELSFATSHYNDDYLDRRISSRIRRTESDGYAEYYERLQTDPAEHRALLESMSINVTGFFRNPEVWAGIRAIVRELASDAGQLRIWSAACADGREPYSISMLVHDDQAIDPASVEILATDISEPALETARRGVYTGSRTADIDDQLQFIDEYTDYVDVQEGTYTITDQIKRLVSFERHDLITDDPIPGFDLIVCRNVLIYIDAEHKRPMLETLSKSLRSGGYLVIGKAETIPPGLDTSFCTLEPRLRMYSRR